jgi:hypothetical protein
MTTPQTDKTTATPRSDAAILEGYTERSLVSWDFARQLETELTTATAAKLDAERKVAEMRAVLEKRQPRIGAWENTCYLCGSKTECGDIDHKPDCSFLLISSTTLGQGWMSPEEVAEMRSVLMWAARVIEYHLGESIRGASKGDWERLTKVLASTPDSKECMKDTRLIAKQAREIEKLKAKLSELEREVETEKNNHKALRDHYDLLKKETGCPNDEVMVIHHRELKEERDTSRERCARLEGALKQVAPLIIPRAEAYDRESPMTRPAIASEFDSARRAIEQALAGSAGGEVVRT